MRTEYVLRINTDTGVRTLTRGDDSVIVTDDDAVELLRAMERDNGIGLDDVRTYAALNEPIVRVTRINPSEWDRVAGEIMERRRT